MCEETKWIKFDEHAFYTEYENHFFIIARDYDELDYGYVEIDLMQWDKDLELREQLQSVHELTIDGMLSKFRDAEWLIAEELWIMGKIPRKTKIIPDGIVDDAELCKFAENIF